MRRGSVAFVAVLVIGLAIFVLAGMLAGFSGFETAETDNENILFATDFGDVGNVTQTARTVFFGDIDVGNTETERVLEEEELFWTSRGLFNENARSFTFDLQNPQSGMLRFEISSTNALNDLRVRVNEEVVQEKTLAGGDVAEIDITEHLQQGSNTVTFDPKSAGLFRFWTENRYLIADMEIEAQDRGSFSFKDAFRIFPYETDNFDCARLSFFVDDAQPTDSLSIQINGNEIAPQDYTPVKRESGRPYEIPAAPDQCLTKLDTNLHPGENTLSMRTSGGAFYTISGARLTIRHFATTRRQTLEETFNVTGSQLSRIERDDREGELSFTVAQVKKSAPITVTINNNATFTTTPQAGTRTFTFDAGTLYEGRNTVEFSTEGAYEINDFRLRIVLAEE